MSDEKDVAEKVDERVVGEVASGTPAPTRMPTRDTAKGRNRS